MLHAAFPNARILSVQNDIEPWMPFSPRVRLSLADGSESKKEGEIEREVDFRGDIDPTRAEVPSPRWKETAFPARVSYMAPVPNTDGNGYLSLCEVPQRGESGFSGRWEVRRTAFAWRQSAPLKRLTVCKARRTPCLPIPSARN